MGCKENAQGGCVYPLEVVTSFLVTDDFTFDTKQTNYSLDRVSCVGSAFLDSS